MGAEWAKLPLSRLATVTKGRSVVGEPPGPGLPYLTAAVLRGAQADRFFTRNPNLVCAQSTDTIVLWDGAGAGDVFAGAEGVVASTMARIRPLESVLPDFLTYALLSHQDALRAGTQGTTVPHVNGSQFRSLLLAVPDLEVQRRLVDLLQAADRRIDAQEELVRARRAARWALLVSMIEAHSATRRLCDVADVQLGKTINPREADLEPKHAYLRTANVLDGTVSLDDLKQMHFSTSDLCKYQILKDDVLVLEGGDAGRTALYGGDDPMPYQNHIHRVRAKTGEILPQYLALAIEYSWRSGQLEALCGQTTIKSLPIGKFREFQILCPLLADQQRLVDVVSAAEGAMRNDETALVSMRKARAELLHELLSGNHRIPETYDDVLG